jgi:tRNA nucleotidyltransferase (CCA-adding enzyme)
MNEPKPLNIYLVGGAVRDRLLGRPEQDKDFVVVGASEDEFLNHFPHAKKVGQRHPVYIVGRDEYVLSAASDIQADLLSRDLTINALAQDLGGRIFGHPQARSDLKQAVLRPISEQNFLNDPLRVFRAARLAACLPNFGIHPSLEQVMGSVGGKGGLEGVAAERVGNEVLKACACPQPGRFLTLLACTGTLAPWLDELLRAADIPAGPSAYHSGSLLDHLTEIMNRLAGSALGVWMGLCHDLGKTRTDPQQWPKHHGHDLAGEELALNLGNRLRLPSRYIRAGAVAARWHMVAGRYDQLRPGTKVDLLVMLHKCDLVQELFEVVRADKGRDQVARAQTDMRRILSVRLSGEYREIGPKAGEMLRHLRCRALSGDRVP